MAAAWLAGLSLSPGSALHHKLAHVLGGYGLPHAETHAIILPHATRFNLAAAGPARARLAEALRAPDPAAALAAMVHGFPIPQRLREVGLKQERIADAAAEVAALDITAPRYEHDLAAPFATKVCEVCQADLGPTRTSCRRATRSKELRFNISVRPYRASRRRTRSCETLTESTLAIPYSSRVATSHSPAQATICRAIKSAMRVDNGYGAVSFIILLI